MLTKPSALCPYLSLSLHSDLFQRPEKKRKNSLNWRVTACQCTLSGLPAEESKIDNKSILAVYLILERLNLSFVKNKSWIYRAGWIVITTKISTQEETWYIQTIKIAHLEIGILNLNSFLLLLALIAFCYYQLFHHTIPLWRLIQ